MNSHSTPKILKLAILPLALATVTGTSHAANFGFSAQANKAPVISVSPLQDTLELDPDVTPTYNSYGNQDPNGPFGDRLDRDVPGVSFQWGNGVQPAVQPQPGGPEILVNNLTGRFPANGSIEGIVYAKQFGIGERPINDRGLEVLYSPLTAVFVDGVEAELNYHDTFDINSIASFSGDYAFDDPRTLDFVGIDETLPSVNKPIYMRKKGSRPSEYGRKGKDSVVFEAFDQHGNVDRKTYQRHYSSTNQEAYINIRSNFIYDNLIPEIEKTMRTKLNPRRLLSRATVDKSWGQVRFPNAYGSVRFQDFTVDCYPEAGHKPGSCFPAIRFTVKLEDIQTDIDVNSPEYGNWDFRVSADYLRLSGWVVLSNKNDQESVQVDVEGLDFGYSNLETSGSDGADLIDSFIANAVDFIDLDDMAVDLLEAMSINSISDTLSEELTKFVNRENGRDIKELVTLSVTGIAENKSSITRDAVEIIVESNLDALDVSRRTANAFGSLWNPIQAHDKPSVQNWRKHDIAIGASTNLLNRALFSVFRSKNLNEIEVYGGDEDYVSAIDLGTLLGLHEEFPNVFKENHQGRVVLSFESSPYIKLHNDENSFIKGEAILHANNIKLSVQQRQPEAYGNFPWKTVIEATIGIQHPIDFDIDEHDSSLSITATPDTLPVISAREPRLIEGDTLSKDRFSMIGFMAIKTALPQLTQPIVNSLAQVSLDGITIPSISGYEVTPNDIWVSDNDNDGFGWLMFGFDVDKQQNNNSTNPSAEELADRYQNSGNQDAQLVGDKPIDQFGLQCKYGPCDNHSK